jgi:hypothetical protein
MGNIEDELEEIKKELAKMGAILKPSMHGFIDLDRQGYHIENLQKTILKLEAMGTEISKKKHFVELKSILNEYLNSKGSIKNFKKWEISLYKNLWHVIKELNIYEEFNQKKDFGTYNFSQIFPKTFEFLKIYVPMRRPEYIGRKIPDVKVKLTRGKLHKFILGAIKRKGFPGMNYWDANNKINIDLTNILPINLIPKNEEDIKKILKYFDFSKTYNQMLIHEYEHYLQYKKLPWPLRNYYYYRTNLKKGVGFNYPLQAVVLMKTLGLPIDFLIKKLFKKAGFVMTLAEYKYTRNELEARLAQFIFLIAYDYPETDIVGSEGIHRKFLGKVERDREVYLAGLREQEEKLNQLRTSRALRAEIKQVNKNIEALKKRIWEMEQFEKDYSYLLEEARKIGLQIKEKREAILKEVSA